MSDRIATECGELRNRLEKLHDRIQNHEHSKNIRVAASALLQVEQWDREENGHTPEDALAAHVENTDECPSCGTEIDEGGWCSFSCMQDDLGDSDE
jgi:DNA repair exonuclease SbcCD ATPase subunit